MNKKTTVTEKIKKELLCRYRIKDKSVKLSIREAHTLIKYGAGAFSCTRYLRKLRQYGEITYDDPRKIGYYYIKLKPLFFINLKKEIDKRIANV